MAKKVSTIYCPYCKNVAKWVNNREVYGKQYGKSYMCYWCKECDAYVGCHQNSQQPLGTMANKHLRTLRRKAHAHVDPLWKDGHMTRKEMYASLKKIFGYEVHIGASGIELCQAILKITHEEILNK